MYSCPFLTMVRSGDVCACVIEKRFVCVCVNESVFVFKWLCVENIEGKMC